MIKSLHISIILVLLFNVAIAQQWTYQNRDYLFINYDTNYLHFYGDTAYADNFFNQLDRLITHGEGKINVLHFGGSHIQAGYWSGQIKKRMENIVPGLSGSMGFVFPFTIANTNIPFHYRAEFTGDWDYSRNVDKKPLFNPGAGGMVAHANDTPASIIIRKHDSKDLNHYFNKITLFHDSSIYKYQTKINLSNNNKVIYKHIEPYKTIYYLLKPVDTLNFEIAQTDSLQDHFTFYGAYLENDESGITYSGIGVNGAATSSYLKSDYFEEQICSMNPDLVIFSIGVNDAAGKNFNQRKYEENYSRIIEHIRKINPGCMFIFTTNNDFYSYSGIHNSNSEAVFNAMKNLSVKYGGAVWDLHSVMGGNRSINIWRSKLLAKKDRIHFTKEGYELIGNLFFDAFLKAYTSYLKEQYQYVGLD
jgi:lysophospholipase L1-like esterase